MKFDLDKLEEEVIPNKIWTVESGKQPCPICGINEAESCGYLVYDGEGDYDCVHSDEDDFMFECEGCKELVCSECKEK